MTRRFGISSSSPEAGLVAAIGFLVLLIGGACARSPRTLAAPEAGSLHETLERFAMYGFSGSVLVEVDGATVLRAGYGLADRERGIPASATTAYDVGSITKTFTAAAVLALADAGTVRLSDSVGKFFVGVPVRTPGITLHHLLTHTSGLPLDPAHAGIDSTDGPAQFIRKTLAVDGGARIGTYEYSNLGYGLLALVVERASGEPFRYFVNRRLLRRAGLSHTSWWGDHRAIDRPDAAVGYVFSDREEVLTPEPAFSRGSTVSPVWSKWPLGAGGMLSTLDDLRRWWYAIETNRVLSPATTRAMLSLRDSAAAQGYGWNVRYRDPVGRALYRGGSRTGYNSMLAVYPDRRALVLFAINQSSESQWAAHVWRAIERFLAAAPAGALPPPTVALSPMQLARLAGTYALPDGARIGVVAERGELLAGALDQRGTVALGCAADSAAAAAGERESLRVLDALRSQSPDTVLLPAAQRASMRDWLRRHAPSGEAGVVLGVTPHPSGPGRVQVFVRTGDAVLRFIWDGPRLLAWTDGVRMPCLGRFRPTSETTAASYSPRAAGWALLEWEPLRTGMKLMVTRRDGVRIPQATRVE